MASSPVLPVSHSPAHARLGLGWVLCRTVLGVVFALAAQSKIRNPAAFAEAIGRYGIVPESWQGFLAYLIAWIEAWVAAALVTGIAGRAAAALALTLLAGFSAASLKILLGGEVIDCGCFGRRQPLTWWHLTENAVFAAMAIFLIARERRNP